MAQSYTSETAGVPKQTGKRRVLVTGAAGNIGSYFAEHSHDQFDLTLMVRETDKGVDQIKSFGKLVYGEIDDLEALKKQCVGIDTVLHLAASAGPETVWDEVLKNNIVGTYNVFVAAKSAGCRRVIFASSIHAISGYPADVQVKSNDPVNPGDIYGVSKCFGEALSRYMAGQENLSAIAIRIGAFQPLEKARDEKSISLLDAFVSRRDLNQLIVRCIKAENVRFAIVAGLSNNRFKRMDISDARELFGYEPVDDATAENPRLKDLHLSDQVMSHSMQDGQKSGIRRDV